MNETIPWLILFTPLAAAVGIVLFARQNRELSAQLSIGGVVVAFWLSALLFFSSNAAVQPFETRVNWLAIDNLAVDFGLQIDRLSMLLLLVVTSVASAIHIYSYEYMRQDRSLPRYFAGMSLFTFSMLGIVLANNFFQMFICWELVGLSSYLLIGFWYERPAAADACKKAFLTNRVGDFGFLLGIILLWSAVGTLHFGELEQKLSADPGALGALSTVAGLLIFCGAMAKSAQFPLHVWLPDAMEGPTPVSALIHAATMVAAGVFMLCRVFFLFSVEPQLPEALAWLNGVTALDVIAWIGMLTALLAAAIAIQQNDIKRVLAYSTLSQLGYMVMAVGVGGPTTAVYHLTTHAFFKALLFLGAGSVICALHHQQDIWKMGGLSRKMPVTFWTFLIATLALCGLPPLSGFFSKDAILAAAYDHSKTLFVLGTLVSALTAFYMFRLVFVVFIGPAKSDESSHARESTKVMTLPMVFLAVPSVLVGFWGVEPYLHSHFEPGKLAEWLPWYKQAFSPFAHAPVAAFGGLGAVAFGFFAAFKHYRVAQQDPLPQKLGWLGRAMQQRFYFDELYEKIIAHTQDALAQVADLCDRWIIAGAAVKGVHGTIEFVGRVLRLVQTGNLQTYAFLFVAGAVALIYWILTR